MYLIFSVIYYSFSFLSLYFVILPHLFLSPLSIFLISFSALHHTSSSLSQPIIILPHLFISSSSFFSSHSQPFIILSHFFISSSSFFYPNLSLSLFFLISFSALHHSSFPTLPPHGRLVYQYTTHGVPGRWFRIGFELISWLAVQVWACS